MTSILLAYGSKRGGTEGLENTVADALREEGFMVEVAPARTVRRLEGYESVVVAGALYASRWHRDAPEIRQTPCARAAEPRDLSVLQQPLDDSATREEIPPVKGVQKLMNQIGARGHVTFGGRLAPDAKGFPASSMAKKNQETGVTPSPYGRGSTTSAQASGSKV